MSLFLSTDDVRRLASPELVLKAARAAVEAEAAGRAHAPPRLDVDLPRGFLRTMPGAMGELMGCKVMTLVRGVGNRYLLLVYAQTSGELLALLDAGEVTRLRTAGITAVAAALLQPEPQAHLALFGSGFEATTHLHAMARLWPLRTVRVHSPNQARREAFAERERDELGVDVEAVAGPREALSGSTTVVLATKASEPVIDGRDFEPGAVVLSIGSTRLDLRELDRHTFERAAVVVVDDVASVLHESGDVKDAVTAGAIAPDQLIPLGTAARSPERLRPDGTRDLLVFKSVGTAVQDLALAGALIEEATAAGLGRELGELTGLKPAPPPAAPTAAV